MNVVRALDFNGIGGISSNQTLNIRGTPDFPLFQVDQVGELLGLVDIRERIEGYDADDKRVTENILCLSDFGIYHLLSGSRKPISEVGPSGRL